MLRSVKIGVCDINAVTPYSITRQFYTKVWINEAVQVKVRLDSGSAGNFMSLQAVQRCGLKTQSHETPLSVTHVQGGKVGIVTEQVWCRMRKGNHSEDITFDVVPLGKPAIIIGMPWFEVHEPALGWKECKVFFESQYCKENCTGIAPEDMDELEIMEIAAVSEEEKGTIPREYHDLLDTFDIERAQSMLNTQGEFDFKINLIPGVDWPKPSKLYRLTPDQMEEAKSQIKELEDVGMISPSTSPFAAPLFFIPKKDSRQWMCIDYRKLNKITIQDAYPLPNMESLLESARGVTVFSKFDL